VATFPGKPPNPLGVKVELLLNTTWTDITLYVMLRDLITISNMGRADESNSITAASITMTLKNDGRFTPKNSSGAYYPNIVRNCQVRVSVNATSLSGVAYNQFRFFGEIYSWPPSFDISQRDTYVSVIASGIWRRISASTTNMGSATARSVALLTGTSVPVAYWAMEDGTNTTGFVLSSGAGTNLVATGTPSYAADSTSFPGSNAIPQFNYARLAANVTAGPTPTSNVVRFGLSVPAAGDSEASTFAAGAEVCKILSAGTIGRVDVSLVANQLQIHGYLTSAGGTAQFSGTITTLVSGVPVIVSVEITPSGSSIAWALRIIKPSAGTVLDQVSGTRTASSIGAVSQIQLDGQGRLADTSAGHLGVYYAVPSLTTAATAAGGNAGELAVTRFTRLCTESNIPSTVIGSGGAAMGPQVDGTLAAAFQEIEDTDGGLLYETRDQFGLGYRTLASLQNQSAAVSFAFTSGVLGAPLAPTYDDQLVKNQWTVTNWDGYAVIAELTSGAISIAAPPNGVGSGYSASKTINASSDTQANTIAQQLLFQGTVDDLRFPVVSINFQRTPAAPFFSSIPSLRIGDYLSISSMPGYLGGGTAKQLIWGYTEKLGGDIPGWEIDYNTVPELPFETSFSPGVFSVAQVPAGSVAAGSPIGSTVSGSQLGAGSVPATALSATISARTIGGTLQIIGPATPYDWTFAVTGTPADVNYFICTQVQSLPIAVGDTFTNSGGLGGPFTVTSIDSPSGGNAEIHFTPAASSVMSTGTVFGGKNGDQWVNTSGGNQVNQWGAGAWTPIQFGAAAISATSRQLGGIITTVSATAPASPLANDLWINTAAGNAIEQYNGTAWVLYQFGSGSIAANSIAAAQITANTITASQIAAGTITATQIAANTITAAKIAANTITATQIAASTITASNMAAGVVIAGVVNGTVITGATIIADGTSGEILVYSGTPALGNLIGSWSGSSGSDTPGNLYPIGLRAQAVTLPNLSSAPAPFSGASTLYTDSNGGAHLLSSSGQDLVLDRSLASSVSYNLPNTASFTEITDQWTIEAGDAEVSTCYMVETWGNATWGSPGGSLIFALSLNGGLGGSVMTTSVGGILAGNGVSWTIRLLIRVTTAGSSGVFHAHFSGALTPTGSARGTGITAAIEQDQSSLGINTTVSNTLAIAAAWNATSSGQNLQSYGNMFTRRSV
jgi:hypothetical protein